MKLDINNVEFYLKIHINLNFKDVEFYIKIEFQNRGILLGKMGFCPYLKKKKKKKLAQYPNFEII